MFKEPKAGLKNEKRFADFHNKVISVALLIFLRGMLLVWGARDPGFRYALVLAKAGHS